MSRFYVPRTAVRGKIITVGGEEAHHIVDVMRLGPLDKVVTFDGTGNEYVGFIKDVKDKSLTIEIVETRTPTGKDRAEITLIQAIPKKGKMDYIAQKATELGVHSIIPVMSRRTIPSWNASKSKREVERWNKIAIEASKQCGRSDVPVVSGIEDFGEVVKRSSEYDLCLIAALSDESVKLKDAIKDFKGGNLLVAIGPEGDFTPQEVEEAKDAGFKLVSLGRRVLRSDTAGLAVLAILNYEFSE